ncbi:hypothetical protein VF14_18300 [Nostoc linckia z18]|uniref:Uncharacterized protein n=2 Tax=Nostoc linckia TaxID=92942 RepID=A0A9Q6EJP2_NOSLI|nr:hypothetical protein [Nostoc linckia]PHJ53454.1 hypothetical protein VF02_37185 [Nostoc linckia z1]PHJ81978.1 hypothetical protein VF07_29230 [Nostoc linckia z6]PHJ92876.1 hypothetical protein VF04_27945 [Nostoc linckia z7]PHK00801.1 hypothetical protein VF08_23300 [Nostoc linckia z8]PHK03110.1 hypothetical protein VF10_38450 [Nostoc linckia z13]
MLEEKFKTPEELVLAAGYIEQLLTRHPEAFKVFYMNLYDHEKKHLRRYLEYRDNKQQQWSFLPATVEVVGRLSEEAADVLKVLEPEPPQVIQMELILWGNQQGR